MIALQPVQPGPVRERKQPYDYCHDDNPEDQTGRAELLLIDEVHNEQAGEDPHRDDSHPTGEPLIALLHWLCRGHASSFGPTIERISSSIVREGQ